MKRQPAIRAAAVLLSVAATLAVAPAARGDELVAALTLNDVTVPLGQTVVTGAAIPDATARAQSCSQLRDGTAGAREPVAAPETDTGNGLAPGAASDAPTALPATVPFKTGTETFNRRYWFVVRDGRMWFRSNMEVTGLRQPWRELALPPCFAGRVIGAQADDDEMIVLDRERHVYVMDHALRAPELFNWTDRWGPLFWSGYGRTLGAGYRAWAWSVISPREDVTWHDDAGNAHAVGADKVSHIWTLRDGGRRLAFLDPWLAKDDSYAACGPLRGRFRATNLAASGSTLMVIGAHGDVFTRLYDFDIAGSDPIFFRYSYDAQRGVADPAIQLPSPAWKAQPKVPGRITNVISVEKQGQGATRRTLRVEGLDRQGRVGYWQKDVAARRWAFHRTGRRLLGKVLDNPSRNTAGRGLAPSQDRSYAIDRALLSRRTAYPAGRWAGEITDFNLICSPSRLRVQLGPTTRMDLRLHSVDGLRLTARGTGLDDVVRAQFGAVEVPDAVRRSADPLVRAWLAQTGWGTRRFTEVKIEVTAAALTLIGPQGDVTFRAR